MTRGGAPSAERLQEQIFIVLISHLMMKDNGLSENEKWNLKRENVTTIVNVTQFTVECKRSGWFLLFSITFVCFIFFSFFFLFISDQFENSMRWLNQQINEKFSSSLNGSKLEVGQSSAIPNQSTVWKHDYFFFKSIFGLWTFQLQTLLRRFWNNSSKINESNVLQIITFRNESDSSFQASTI